MRGDELAALVDGAYAAALDGEWGAWTARIMAAFGSAGGLFVPIGPDGVAVDRAIGVWPSPRSAEEYLGEWYRFDPQVPAVMRLERSTVYLETDHLDENDPGTAAYMRWQRDRGFDHHMTAVGFLGEGRHRCALSMHRRTGHEQFSGEEQAALRTLVPELERAWALGFRHAELLAQSFWNGVVAQNDGRAIMLLDERGRMVRATESALSLCDVRDGLTLAGGRLRARDPEDDVRVQAAIDRAVRGEDTGAGTVRIARSAGRPPLLATVYPLPRSRRLLAPFEAAALVTIVDPARSPASPVARLRRAFGLTEKEAELAALLGTGHSVEAASGQLAIAISTARLHLRRIFAKTDTSRQAELVLLLARLG